MPLLARFYGISIYMYVNDHGPAHFHARRGSQEVLVAVADGSVLHGRLTPTDQRRVRRWWKLHRSDLENAWDQASRGVQPSTIEPLP